MPSPTICAVSGVVKDTSGNGLINVTVNAYCDRPFIHPSDGSLIVNYSVSTVTDATGAWTLNLIETTTPSVSLTVSFLYPSSSQNFLRKEYTVTVPATTTALFSTLIGGQI